MLDVHDEDIEINCVYDELEYAIKILLKYAINIIKEDENASIMKISNLVTSEADEIIRATFKMLKTIKLQAMGNRKKLTKKAEPFIEFTDYGMEYCKPTGYKGYIEGTGWCTEYIKKNGEFDYEAFEDDEDNEDDDYDEY